MFMETLRETRQNGHKDTKKKKEKGSQKHYDKQDKMDILKDTTKMKEKRLWKH